MILSQKKIEEIAVAVIQKFKTVCGMSGDLSCSLTWSLTKFF